MYDLTAYSYHINASRAVVSCISRSSYDMLFVTYMPVHTYECNETLSCFTELNN